MSATWAIALVLLVSGAAWAGTGLVLRLLSRAGALDHPNERSSHDRPIPRGAGLAVIGACLPAWLAVASPLAGADDLRLPIEAAVAGLAVLLAGLSFADDLRGLPPLPRFATQVAAVVPCVLALPAGVLVFQGLFGHGLDRAATVLVWLWFINLFNFMDGIDGISAVETIAIGAGIALLAALGTVDAVSGLQGLALAAAAFGFLVWNWHPARIFLGDVGSIPLGFLLGWLLLKAAAAGLWAVALILPLYYLADATITLARRVARGEKIWRPHREHFYQRAVQAGWSHAHVAGWVLLADLGLMALAAGSVLAPGPALAGSVAVVAALLVVMARRAP